jgi:uncharacterized protein YdhG (YjbR/CyaY superfamily)
MQYDVETPSEYLKALEDDWRKEKLQCLREIILSKEPEIVESIKYLMLSYGDGREDVFGLNAQKHYVSLYVADIKKIDESGELLKGLNVGKGCIRFTKTRSISGSRIDEFIERTLNLWKNNKDTSC